MRRGLSARTVPVNGRPYNHRRLVREFLRASPDRIEYVAQETADWLLRETPVSQQRLRFGRRLPLCFSWTLIIGSRAGSGHDVFRDGGEWRMGVSDLFVFGMPDFPEPRVGASLHGGAIADAFPPRDGLLLRRAWLRQRFFAADRIRSRRLSKLMRSNSERMWRISIRAARMRSASYDIDSRAR